MNSLLFANGTIIRFYDFYSCTLHVFTSLRIFDSLILILRSIVLCNVIHDIAVCATQKTKKPENVESLKRNQQTKRNNVGDPAFVLLRLPVEFVRPYSSEFGN
jgi:hypothetical protein